MHEPYEEVNDAKIAVQIKKNVIKSESQTAETCLIM
jgi:hypothetical protein